MRLRAEPPVTQTPTVRGLYTNAEMIKRCAAIFGQLLFLDRTDRVTVQNLGQSLATSG